jgi:hypothetical protein
MKAFMKCLLILIVPNWKLGFHVHIDAPFFSLGVILHQNLDNTIDRPIYYASKLMKSAKNNYTAIEKKTLAMIYVVKKFIIY